MTENDELASQYIVAQGPDGLSSVLSDILTKALSDSHFAATPHYILYQLKNQKSLIKADMSEKPFQFWYYDLLGRPAPNNVKETIARFLWEKCGEKEQYLQEVSVGGKHE